MKQFLETKFVLTLIKLLKTENMENFGIRSKLESLAGKCELLPILSLKKKLKIWFCKKKIGLVVSKILVVWRC